MLDGVKGSVIRNVIAFLQQVAGYEPVTKCHRLELKRVCSERGQGLVGRVRDLPVKPKRRGNSQGGAAYGGNQPHDTYSLHLVDILQKKNPALKAGQVQRLLGNLKHAPGQFDSLLDELVQA